MKKMKFRSRLHLLILLILLLIGLISFAVGKYVRTMTHSGTVTFTARLAENVEIWEHEAERKTDGTYVLTDETVSGNSYVLIPGLDIPKDPRVVITGKTEIPAHLYVEIVSSTVDRYESQPVVTYVVSGDWEPSNRAALHGGVVYEYVGDDNTALALTTDNTPSKIYILSDDKVYVSQHAKYADNTADGDTDVIEIYVYLVEVTD